MKLILTGCPTIRDLANSYFGGTYTTTRTAVKHFKMEIDRDEELSEALRKAKYEKWHQHFIPQQVRIIYEHWGPPNEVEKWMKEQNKE